MGQADPGVVALVRGLQGDRCIEAGGGRGEELSGDAAVASELLAWGNLYSEAALAIAHRRYPEQVPAPGPLVLSGWEDGIAGIRFADTCVDSAEAGGIWADLP